MGARQAGLNPAKWNSSNRPTPLAVSLLVRGFLAAAALTGGIAGLAVAEIATRKWPTPAKAVTA